MKVVIMQPTYLPWMGYFGMLDLADIFIFYDDVQFSKQSWQNRNRIKLTNGELSWLSVPTIRDSLNTNINEVKINNSTNWKRKHWQSIYYSYCKSEYFKKYEEEIQELYSKEWEKLDDFNIYVIKKLSSLLGVRMPKIIKSSEINETRCEKTDRLVSILKKVGADEYISPEGSKGYMETSKFLDQNIKLYWYEYKHPIYPQNGDEFTPYVSAIDLLFNTGENSIEYIRKGYESALVEAK